jgi:hypothetical protein
LSTPASQSSRFLEGLFLLQPKGVVARVLWIVLGLSLLACAALMIGTGPRLPLDLFFAPVLVACILFRRKGLWVIPPALVLYHLCSLAGDRLGWSGLLVRDLLELAEWLLLAGFILVTLDRFEAVKRYQARVTRDIGMARTLQSALVPPDYDFGRVRIQGLMRQCQAIGGDFYYFRPFQEKYVVFCLGDTMGKGISASMLMAILMGFFFEWGKRSPSPGVVLGRLNRRLLRLCAEDTTWFATLFYGVFDEESSVLTFASGGHHAGLLLRSSGEVEELRAEGLPVGVFDDVTWTESRKTLQPGDRVVLFTDGLVEARSASGDLFGMERLERMLSRHAGATSEDLLHRLEEAVMAYSGGNLTDDLAILVLEIKPGTTWDPSIRVVRTGTPDSGGR